MSKSLSPFRRLILGAILLAQLFILPASLTAAPVIDDGEAAPHDSKTLYAPMTFNYVQRYNVPSTLFGVQLYGNSTDSIYYFQDMLDTNASWVRNELAWSSVERTEENPANYTWTSADRVIGVADDANINVVLTLRGAPSWARLYEDTANGPIAPDYIDDFADFVEAIVERYDGDGYNDMPGNPVVTHFEFYNEGDRRLESGSRGGWGNHPEEYAAMLAAVYPAAKRANPNAQILFSGIAYDWFESEGGPYVEDFLDGVLADGGGAYFDIMNFHAYPSFSHNWTDQGLGVYEKTQAVNAKLAQYSLQKPIMITEAGWHSNNDPDVPSTPEWQARYVVQMYAESAAAGIWTMIWFSMVDGPEWFPTKNGLVTSDDPTVRKIAFDAYVVMEAKMDGMAADGILSDGDTGNANMQAYRFRHSEDGHTLYIAWLNPIDTDATANLQVSASSATVSDIYGNSSAVNDGDDGRDDGKVTVSVGAQPVYIEVE